MQVRCFTVGNFQVNTYLLTDEATGQSAIVDTGETRELVQRLQGLDPAPDIRMILLTHGHLDHAGALSFLQEVWDVPTYLPHAILATLFCCLPFGIAAIVYAAKVGTMQAVGNFEEATRASDQARMWCWISFGCGLVGTVLYLIFMLSVGSGASRY